MNLFSSGYCQGDLVIRLHEMGMAALPLRSPHSPLLASPDLTLLKPLNRSCAETVTEQSYPLVSPAQVLCWPGSVAKVPCCCDLPSLPWASQLAPPFRTNASQSIKPALRTGHHLLALTFPASSPFLSSRRSQSQWSSQ